MIVDGQLRQLATPQELVARPADGFVAAFTGANLLHGIARAGRDGLTEIVLDSGEIDLLGRPGRGAASRSSSTPGRSRVGPCAPGRLGAERDRGRDPLGRARRQPRARADRARHRRGDRGVGRAARARRSAARRSPRSRRPARGSSRSPSPGRLTVALGAGAGRAAAGERGERARRGRR